MTGSLPLADLAARVRAGEPRLGGTRLVCIDGPAGSGKTTLTARLAAALGDDAVVRTRRGERATDVFTQAAGTPAALVAAGASGKPVVVYPNSGERWDAAARRWTGAAGLPGDAVQGWLDDGARLVGGCCRVGPADIARVAAVVDQVG